MANQGILELSLLDVRNQPAQDPNTTVKFKRISGPAIGEVDSLVFPPTRRFQLPAFPQASNVFCDITCERFRSRKTSFFTLMDGETIIRNPTMFRDPSEWDAEFIPWNVLSNSFLTLQDVLGRSSDIKVAGRRFDAFVGSTYDGLTEQTTILAKTALLNLYAALTAIKDPTSSSKPWFSHIDRMFIVTRERFIASVSSTMANAVQTIRDNIDQFSDYERAPSDLHFDFMQQNMPAGYQVFKTKMFSIKSGEEHANIQLTIAPSKDPSGNDVTLLDADIDESGELIAHLLDVFMHKFTGGTHPYDIHEYLALAHPDTPLGYDLV